MAEKYIKASECEKYFYEHLDDNGMIGAMNAIDEIPAADVHPVEKWCEYGFEYREPAEYGYYLTYYHGRIHVSEWSVSGWYNETGLPIDDDVVEYWQPLPEPPVND